MIGQSTLPSDSATGWLASLIEVMETVRSCAVPCDRSVSEALQDRLHRPALLQPKATLH